MTLKLVILFTALLLLLLIPVAGAAYDVVSNISSNSTEYTTSATYGELHNISLATGTGTTFLTASWDARVNFTAPLYGRFVRDGVSLGRFNLTQNVYATVGSYQISFAETTGTHYYGWEVYSNKKGTIYSRNFSAFFLVNGSFSAASYNATYDAYQALISALQNNDTVDRAYVNNTFLPILTYSGNFPNNTVAANLANWNATYNSSYNTLLTNAPNTTVAGNLVNWNATYNSSYAYGGFDILFSNGTNNITVGTKAHVKAKYAGTLTDLTAHSVETGSINISAYNLTLGTYIGSVIITAGTDGNTTGLSYVFAKGDWLNLTVSSVTGIKQVTAAVQTVRS